jgi:hypothetical protein
VAQPAVGQARVARSFDALAIRSPAPAVEPASKPVRRDLRESEVAAEVRAAVGDDVRSSLEIAIENEPARSELDVAHASRAKPSRRLSKIPPLANDAWAGKRPPRLRRRRHGLRGRVISCHAGMSSRGRWTGALLAARYPYFRPDVAVAVCPRET